MRTSHPTTAVVHLRRALELDPTPARRLDLARLHVQLWRTLRVTDPGAAEDHLEAARRLAPDSPDVAATVGVAEWIESHRHIMKLSAQGDRRGAEDVGRVRLAEAVARARALLSDPSRRPTTVVQAVRVVVKSVFPLAIEAGLGALDDLADLALTPAERSYIDLERAALADVEFEFARFALTGTRGLELTNRDLLDLRRPPPGAEAFDTVVIRFLGLAVDRFEAHADVYQRTLPAHVVTIHDDLRLLHLAGISGVDGGLDGAVEFLRRRLDLIGATRLVVIGNSAGGLAGLRYAARLGARRFLGFGAPTTVRSGDDVRQPVLRRRLEATFDVRLLDTRPDVEDAPELDVRLYYGADHADDRWHAERLGDLPNVTLYPQHGFPGHAVKLPLRASGEFRLLLADAVG